MLKRERAVMCANGRIHYGPERTRCFDPDWVIRVADDDAPCGPHRFAERTTTTSEWKAAP